MPIDARALLRHPFAATMRAAWIEYQRDRARYLAVAMIYYAIVSLIPLLLLLLSGLGMALRFSTLAAEAERQILLRITATFGPQLAEALEAILDTLPQGSILATAVSLAGLLLTASGLFGHLRMSFRAIWKHDPPLVSGSLRVVIRRTIVEKIIALAMVLGVGALLLAAIAVIAATESLNALLGINQAAGWALTGVSSLLLSGVTFALLFKLLPPVPIRWRDVWLATAVCASAWVIASEVMTFYGMVVENNRSAYGVVGGLLVVLLWMNVVSQVLFFGAEVCKVVATQRDALGPSGHAPAHPPPRVQALSGDADR